MRSHIASSVVITAAACGIGALMIYRRKTLISMLRNLIRFWPRSSNPLGDLKVEIVSHPGAGCDRVVAQLRKDVQQLKVLGLDCEWLTVNGTRRPVALLQLSSKSGLCALIRLCQLEHVPSCVQDLLADETVLKVGVVPMDDSKYLLQDYGTVVKSTLDLRHLAQYLDRHPGSLGKLSSDFLRVDLDKSWRIRCSSWDNPVLTDAQVDYAAKDSLVALEIFREMHRIYCRRVGKSESQALEEFMKLAFGFVDKPFKAKPGSFSGISTNNKSNKSNLINKTQKRNLATRTKPLYDNCLMEAPDGELLCTMDRTKAEWYRKKGLATLVSEDPIRMRLTFEPSGRAVGSTGLYDLSVKENRCVVCGTRDNFSRKFIIPKEYRKFFPTLLKSHSSHDILLLCLDCHRTSHMQDKLLRDRLAVMCNAPLVSHLKKLKTNARALLSHRVPTAVQGRLEQEIRDFYPEEDNCLTEDFLKNLTLLDTTADTSSHLEHARKVTDYFKDPENGGLLELERMWRTHFLDTMRPEHLPDHWSVVHNATRLEIRGVEPHEI